MHDFFEDVKKTVADGIPSSAAIVGEVIKTIYDKTSSATDLANIIENDPPLTLKILKISNSAYYGATKKINSLQRAVVVLGFDTIKELVMTMTVVHSFFQSKDDSAIDKAGLWLHSVGTAKAAQLIAERQGVGRPDVAYTIGLLHDIGKIILALCYPDRYMQVIQYANDNDIQIIQAERRVLNIDHCMLGKILCDLWELPEELSTAILYHHEPLNIPDGDNMISRLAHIGDYMSRKAKIGYPGDKYMPEPEKQIFDIFGSNPKEINLSLSKVYKEFLDSKQDLLDFFTGLK